MLPQESTLDTKRDHQGAECHTDCDGGYDDPESYGSSS